MLILQRRKDGEILIGDNIVVKVIDIRHDSVRLGIEAPPNVRVDRKEI
jgi:carbon storage regulator